MDGLDLVGGEEGEGKGNFFMSLMLSFSSHINGKSDKASDIKWNFEKFLVDREGNVVKRFNPTVKPEQLEAYVEELISK